MAKKKESPSKDVAVLDTNRPLRNPKYKKVKGAYPKYVVDPVSKARRDIPQDPLVDNASVRDVITRSNQLLKLFHIQAAIISDWRDWFAAAKKEGGGIINVDAVSTLASVNASKTTIANLLGFDIGAFAKRKELNDAYEKGAAELKLVLGQKQIESALGGDTIMQIFLGKNILDQRNDPVTQVNIQNNVSGSTLRTKIKQQRELAQKEWNDTVEAVDVEIKDSEPNET